MFSSNRWGFSSSIAPDRARNSAPLAPRSYLHVGAITTAILEIVPPLLDEPKQAHPDVTVFVNEIDSVDAVPALEAGELDLVFVRVDGEVGNGILTMPLADDRLGVALPKDHRSVAAA